MYISIQVLAQAINEKRHIRPEELTIDNVIYRGQEKPENRPENGQKTVKEGGKQ